MCSLIQSFQLLATRSCGWLGALEDSNRQRTRFLILPKRPKKWHVDAHSCQIFNNADLGFGPRDTMAHFPVFLHLCTTNFPGPDSMTCSDQALQKRLKRQGTAEDSHALSMPSLRRNSAGMSFPRQPLPQWSLPPVARDLHRLQHPDLPLPSLRTNMA